MRRALTLVAFWTLAAVALTAPARAQDGLDVRSSTARGDFPSGLLFALEVSAPQRVDEVRLVYEVAPDGVRAVAVPECTGQALVNCTYLLGASRANLLIPGAEVTYLWLVSSGGVERETASQTVTYEDDRFDWRTVSEGNVTVWWYRGSEDEARGILAAARDTLDRIGALLQTTVEFPVKVRYYASARDMQPAIVDDNQEGVVTLGEVVYSDTAMVSADAAPEEITRHELAHIVVREAVRGPFGVPDWLNEGTAVYAQSAPLESQRQALELAVRSNRVFSVRSLSSASTGALSDRVSLFYAQSWSLVDFLVSTYGEERFAQLFRTFREGAGTGEALQAVYGFDQDGLENAWRESVGLPPRVAPTPAAAAQPTEQAPAQDTAVAGSDGSNVAVIVVIAVLTALLAGGLVVTGVVLARRLG